MDNKKLLVSFLAIATFLFAISIVSATGNELTGNALVKVDGMYIISGNDVSVVAGELATVEVYFISDVNDQDVTIKAELEGDKADVSSISSSFDVETNKSYRKTLTIRVPYELKDSLSDDLTLTIKIDGKNSKTELDEITLRVQRPSYNADIKSISVQGTVNAGENFPVDIVLKNIGYDNLDDLYVTASIPELGIQREGYFGDLVAIECDKDTNAVDNYGVNITRKCNENSVDTISGRLSLNVPYNAKAGTYTLEVDVKNDDTTSSGTTQLKVVNNFPSNLVVSNTMATIAVGENAEYDLLVVNPTNQLKVYRIVTESSGSLSSSADSAVIAVPAGLSKTVKITATADAEGEYNFKVNVFAGEQLVDTANLTAKVQGKSKNKVGTSNPVVLLTVILAIIFIVLLIVLIVLIGKKPEKSEEFGESYY